MLQSLSGSLLNTTFITMKIVITAATKGEWTPTWVCMDPGFLTGERGCSIHFHTGRVGMLATAVSLIQVIIQEKPDLIIQMGIAGTFEPLLPIGTVVAVKEEILGDTGVWEDGIWKDLFDMSLEEKNQSPFKQGRLSNPFISEYNVLNLPAITGITVNQVSTDNTKIEHLIHKYQPVIESMEGAALHYVCTLQQIPFLQIRSISNMVGDRNKQRWNIPVALQHLNKTILDLVAIISQKTNL